MAETFTPPRSERLRWLGRATRGNRPVQSKEPEKSLRPLEIFQIAVAIFVSLTTAFIGWKTFQLNEMAGVNNERLRQIEIRLSERKLDFEQSKDVYDRVEKYLSSEQDERRGRALVILVSAIPESTFRANLLSMLTVQAKQESVATAAAESYVGRTLPTPKRSAGFEGVLELQRALEGQPTYALLKDFSFADSAGKVWTVPKGFVFTGSSVPRAAWSVVSPDGEALRAFILHDYFTTRRSEPASSVNQMFYEALVTAGVSTAQAKVLYVAAQTFGPSYSAAPR